MRKMSGKLPILVRLFLDDSRLAERWKDALFGDSFRVVDFGARENPAGETERPAKPHIVVVSAPDDRFRVAAAGRRSSSDEAAVVIIVDEVAETATAVERARTVRLRHDASKAEIVQICQLLGEIVQLRQRIRRQRRQGRRLARLAETDPLTGLPNRRSWERELRRRARRRNEQGPDCLALFDLDEFKQVNDAHGLARGDQVLIAASTALRQGVRAGDFVARLGGDEFGVLLAGLQKDAALAVVDRLRGRIHAGTAAAAAPITASAGYVPFVTHKDVAPDSLILAADQALRLAKRQGRDCAVAGNES